MVEGAGSLAPERPALSYLCGLFLYPLHQQLLDQIGKVLPWL